MKPVLIVTCKAGSEEWCENEIGNILFPIDPDIVIRKTKYSGLLIVYSKRINSSKAYIIASRYEYGFVRNIIPVIHYSENIDEILEYIDRNPPDTDRVKLRVRVRGRRGLSRILWDNIVKILGKHGIKHDPHSDRELCVDVIDDLIYIGYK